MLPPYPMRYNASLTCLQKTAIAVAHCKAGKGLIKINGQPIETIPNETHRFKVLEPVLLLGLNRYSQIDIRIRVTGGGYTAQVYGTLPLFYTICVSWNATFASSRSLRSRNLLLACLLASLPLHSYSPGARKGDCCILPKVYVSLV